MKFDYVKFKQSKRIPKAGPGQTTGIESCKMEFFSEAFELTSREGMMVVKDSEGRSFAYPLSDIEHSIPAAEQAQQVKR